MTFRAHVRALLVLGLPLVGSAVAGFAIHMTDTLMLGWYDVTSLAAATVVTSLLFVVFIVGAGFGNAVMPLVAEAWEQSDTLRVRRVTRMAGWWSVAFAAVMTGPFFWAEDILLAMGQTPDVAAEGHLYLRIAVLGMLPMLLVNVLRAYLSAQNLTAVMLYITLGSVVLNAGVNYLLIFGNFGFPELGIEGAAIASVLLQVVQVLALGAYAARRLPEVRLFERMWRSDPEALWLVFRLGLPIGLTALAESGLFAGSSVMMGWIGEIELAAHGVALQLVSLMFMFHIGISQAATIRAGNALARQDALRLWRGGVVAYAVSLAFGVIVVLVFVTMPGPLVSAFIRSDEVAREAVLQIGVTLMLMSALFQLVDAAQIIALSLLRGVQDTTVPMWMAVVSYWGVGIPAGYLMAFNWDMGPVGLWLGLTVGLTAAATSLGWRFWARSVHLV